MPLNRGWFDGDSGVVLTMPMVNMGNLPEFVQDSCRHHYTVACHHYSCLLYTSVLAKIAIQRAGEENGALKSKKEEEKSPA